MTPSIASPECGNSLTGTAGDAAMTRKTSILAVVALLTAAPLTAASAEPGGCLKYGAAGAVGGHIVHHGVLGAVGGCATGMYVRHKFRKEAREKAALYDQEHPGSGGTCRALDIPRQHGSGRPATGSVRTGRHPALAPPPAARPVVPRDQRQKLATGALGRKPPDCRCQSAA